MLINRVSVPVRLKSSSLPRKSFLSFPLGACRYFQIMIEQSCCETKGSLNPQKKKKKGWAASSLQLVTATRKQHCRGLNLNKSLLSRHRSCAASSQAFGRWYRVTYSFFATAGEQYVIVTPWRRTPFTAPPQHNGPSQRDALQHFEGFFFAGRSPAV